MFYGIEPVAEGAPVTLVTGNCQAEALRIVLAGPGDLATVRVPPLHELTARDALLLHRWLARADVLVAQPVRDGFRGLPVGTAQQRAALAPHARVVRVPVVRVAGLHPTHVIVRPPSDPSLVPPVVPYHDLATLLEAAARRDGTVPRRPQVTPAAVRALHRDSQAELRRREDAHGTVAVADLLERPAFGDARTVNHPGTDLVVAIAARVRAALGLGAAPHPGRELLDAVHAPRLAAVAEAFGLQDPPTDAWTVEGRRVDPDELRAAHLTWYAGHPEAVAAGLVRHARALRHLGA